MFKWLGRCHGSPTAALSSGRRCTDERGQTPCALDLSDDGRRTGTCCIARDIIRKLLSTPALPPPQVVPIPSDRDILIQRLIGAICPPNPVAQERSTVTDLETILLKGLPVGTVTEEDAASPNPSADSAEGCFSCGVLTHTTDQGQIAR